MVSFMAIYRCGPGFNMKQRGSSAIGKLFCLWVGGGGRNARAFNQINHQYGCLTSVAVQAMYQIPIGNARRQIADDVRYLPASRITSASSQTK